MLDQLLADFHFLRPFWLVGIIPALLLAWLFARRLPGAGAWRRAVDPGLLEVLLDPGERGPSRTVGIFVGLGLALACVALAGPTWQRLPQPVEQRNDALVVVLDLSLSMFAQDLAPSRLVRAKHKVTDVLRRRTEGQTALVVYAGDAHTVAPLTDDVNTIENLLTAISPEIMPVLGSNPGDAIAQAHRLFENAGLSQGRILLVTDGVDRIADVTEHASAAFPIAILGVGTEGGAPIPLDFLNRAGQTLHDDRGQPVIARLDPARLATLADVCFGRYADVAIADSDIDHLLDTPLPDAEEMIEIDREFDTWADSGYWLAAALLPFALLSFRRGVFVALVLWAAPLHASVWDDLWQRRDQQASDAMRRGEPERAATLFDDSRWRGVAHYRGGSFERAEESFHAGSDAAAAYNRGNALAHLGRHADAIAAYDQALARDPADEDARFNKELIERLLQQQQQAAANDNQEAQRNRGQQNDAEQSRDGETSQPPRDSQQNRDGSPQDPKQDAEPQEGDEDEQALATRDEGEERNEPRDEEEDALEQWLRRVPDEPGGLLRRKFQYETNQRLREGDYAAKQQDRIW